LQQLLMLVVVLMVMGSVGGFGLLRISCTCRSHSPPPPGNCPSKC